MTRPAFIATVILALAVTAPRPATAQRFATGGAYSAPAGKSPTAEMLRDVKIEQQLDAPLPLDAQFRDEMGNEVPLGTFFKDKPIVVVLVYYRCPMLCTQVLNGLLKVSQAIPQEIGRDYQIVTISIDPKETSGLAAAKKTQYIRSYRREGAAEGWHFLTGDQAEIDRVVNAVGFRYRFDPASGQFAHPSGFVVATPEGHIARYFYGIDYAPRDLRLALIESSAGRVGSPVEQVLLLCYHYDPLTGKYGLAISALLKGAGIVTVGGMGLYLLVMFRRERRRPKLTRDTESPSDHPRRSNPWPSTISSSDA